MNHPSAEPKWLSLLPEFIRIKLQGRNNILAAIHNISWIFLDKVLRAAVGLFVGAWIARYLGPSQFGELAYCIAFIALFQSIANFGLDNIVVREIANNPNRSSVILGTTFRIRLLLGALCWSVAIMFYGVFNGFELNGLLLIALIGMGMVFKSSDTVDLWFQGNSQSKRTVIAKTFALMISAFINVVLILIEAPLLGFALVILIESALCALALYFSYKNNPCMGIWRASFDEAKRLARESWAFMVASLAIIIYMRIDQLMIKYMLGDYELGIYAVVIPISNIWNMIPVAIATSIAPFMARKKSEGSHVFDGALLKIFRGFWLISSLIALVTIVISEVLITVIYGEAYLGAIPVLRIYALTCIPVFLGVAQVIWLLNERKANYLVLQTVVGAIFSVLANYYVLPIWGIEGAAVTAVMSQFLSTVLLNYFLERKLFWMELGIKPQTL